MGRTSGITNARHRSSDNEMQQINQHKKWLREGETDLNETSQNQDEKASKQDRSHKAEVLALL